MSDMALLIAVVATGYLGVVVIVWLCNFEEAESRRDFLLTALIAIFWLVSLPFLFITSFIICTIIEPWQRLGDKES